MSAIVLHEIVTIPEGVNDLDSFRSWQASDECPQRGRYSYLNGTIWIDMSPEDLFFHNQAKHECSTIVTGVVKLVRLGRFFADRTLLTHAAAGLSTEPDGLFVSWESMRRGRIRFVRSRKGIKEIEGSPDMVLEVVSENSVKKDTVTLRKLYWKADIREYWLVDAREAPIRFDILRRGRMGYVAGRKRRGWVESGTFGKSFKLTSKPDEFGYPEYTLSVR